jgi:hypothetical protein
MKRFLLLVTIKVGKKYSTLGSGQAHRLPYPKPSGAPN